MTPRIHRVTHLLAWVALGCGGMTLGRAQVVVDLAGLSCLEVRSQAPTFGQEYLAQQSGPRRTRAVQREPSARPSGNVIGAAGVEIAAAAAPAATALDAGSAAAEILDPIIRAVVSGNVVLDNFGASTRTGSPRTGTSWVGNVTQNADTITVGGLARDENGWGVTGLAIDATGMNSLIVTGQRDAGHAAPTLFVQFEDRSLNTKVYSIDTSLFAVGALTTVQIPLSAWPGGFAFTEIGGWNIGGGGVGTVDFRMTFDHLEFSASAVPEPAVSAVVAGIVLFAVTWYRRFRRGIGRASLRID